MAAAGACRNPRRLASELDLLADTIADMLHEDERFDDAVEFLAERVALEPTSVDTYGRYLSALVFADRVPQAEARVVAWLKLAEQPENDAAKLAPNDLARLQSAVTYARGERRDINMERTEEKWLAPLAEVARRLGTNDHHWDVAGQILGDFRFSDTDEADAVRVDLLERLRADADSLRPHLVQSLVGRVINFPPATTDDDWREIAATVRRRWAVETDAQEKDSLSRTLVTIYSERFATSDYLPFLRARIDGAAESHRDGYRSMLFDALLTQPWSEAIEAEAFKLVTELTDAEDAGDQLAVELPALLRWVNRMLQARAEHAMRELQATGHPENLTRTELAAKYAEFLKAAHDGVADRLAHAEDAAERTFAQWLRIERITLDVQLERRLDDAAAACWEILGDAPPEPASDDEEDSTDSGRRGDEESLAEQRAIRAAILDGVLRSRALAIVSYLAARPTADAALVDRLLGYIDAGIAQGGAGADVWRAVRYEMLIALDRVDDLERDLREWAADGGAVSPWRAPLGRLLAERGQLAEAIGVFEALRAGDALSAVDRATLARWHQAVGRRDDYEQAMVESTMNAEEWQLRQVLENRLRIWRGDEQTLPSELDDATRHAFQALFRKATEPDEYVWLLQEYYEASRDFRLLAMIPDAMLGRTRQQVYPFLESLHSNLLSEVLDEAVADELLARTREIRERELTRLDRRAWTCLRRWSNGARRKCSISLGRTSTRRSRRSSGRFAPNGPAASASRWQSFWRTWARLRSRRLRRFRCGNYGRCMSKRVAAASSGCRSPNGSRAPCSGRMTGRTRRWRSSKATSPSCGRRAAACIPTPRPMRFGRTSTCSSGASGLPRPRR